MENTSAVKYETALGTQSSFLLWCEAYRCIHFGIHNPKQLKNKADETKPSHSLFSILLFLSPLPPVYGLLVQPASGLWQVPLRLVPWATTCFCSLHSPVPAPFS